MSLRVRLIAYIVTLHLIAFGFTIYLYTELGLWVLLVEAVLLVTLATGWWLVNAAMAPLRFLETGVDVLEAEEYSMRFSEVGQTEMDRLIETYNRMLTSLQEERIRTGEQRGILEKLLEATPVGVVALDFEGRVTLANPAAAAFLGSGGDELAGKRPAELTGLGPRLAALPLDQSEVLPVQGGRRLRCLRSHFIDRSFKRDFILIEELTEELRQTEKAAYGKLIRMMSHEVNNTVGSSNSLLGSIRGLKDRLSEEEREPFVQALDAVIQRNTHLNRFMRGFADVIRIPDPVPEPTNVPDLLRGVARLTGADMETRRIGWVEDLPADVPLLPVDAHLFEQVLLNIVRNAIDAIDAGGEGGTITARLRPAHRRWLLEIVDTGGGLTPELEYQIFTPFFTTKPDGQGIGLTLCADILDRHGFAYSLAPGEEAGTTVFRIGIRV